MKIRLTGKQNVYANIVSEYEKLIRLGAIKYGEKLPSCRALALELGINPNTVERAYSELEKEGYIRILPKKGAYADYTDAGQKERIEELRVQLENFRRAGYTREEMEATLDEVYSKEP
jgi:hypothetical protein